jgi:DNA-binding NarL/FixJ family response regulator
MFMKAQSAATTVTESSGEPSTGLSSARRTIRLLLVADVRLYREGMETNLSGRPQFAVVGSVADGEAALGLLTASRPDVVVLDMATRRSFEIVRAIRIQSPAIRIVAFGVEELESEIVACAKAGIAGYVPCEASLDELVAIIEGVVRGEVICTPRIAAGIFRQLESLTSGGHTNPSAPLAVTLTGRERQILELIGRSLSNKEIAAQLGIEVSTVKNHVHNLLEKLRVDTRREAVARLHSSSNMLHRSRQTTEIVP